MQEPRQAAFAVLTKMQKSGAYSTLAVDSAAGAFAADSTARAFFTKLVYGVTERQITLDTVFSRYLKQPLKKLKPEVLTALRLGTYQILYLERVPDSAAVNESVKLVKVNGCAFASGLVNAVLRNVARDGARLPQTDDASAQFINAFSSVLIGYTNRGILATSVWRGVNVGSIRAGDYIENGFALWADSYDNQPEADRAAHKAVPIQCALTLAGSLESVVITVNVRV